MGRAIMTTGGNDKIRSILLLDDNAAAFDMTAILAGLSGFAVTRRERTTGAPRPGERFAAIVALIPGEPMEARRAIAALVAAADGMPVLALGDLPQESTALDLIRLGAEDYLVGGTVPPHALARIVTYAIERRHSADREAEIGLYLSAVLSAVRAPLAITDGDDRLLIVNPGWTEAFGWTAGDCIHKPLEDFLTAVDGIASVRHRDGGVRLARTRTVPVAIRTRQRKVWTLDPMGTPTAVTPPATRTGRMIASRMQIVPMAAVRQELGDRWPRLAERVGAIAERIIRTRLVDGDVFARTETGDFMICFGELKEEAARFKAQQIGHEIRATLIGEGTEPQIVRVETAAIEIAPGDVARPADLAAVAQRKLAQECRTLRDSADRLLLEIADKGALRLRDAATVAGGAADFALADMDADTQATIGRLIAALPDADLRAQLDAIVIAKAAKLAMTGGRTVCAPVSFSTLAQRPSRDRLLAILRPVPDAVRQRLAIRVQDIPAGLLPARIAEVLNVLRPFCRFRMAELDQAELAFSPRDAGVGMLCIAEALLRQDIRAFGRLAVQAREAGVKLALDAVSLHGTVDAARRVGADYLVFAGRPADMQRMAG